MAQFTQMIWPVGGRVNKRGVGLFTNFLTLKMGEIICPTVNTFFRYFMTDYFVNYCVTILKIFIYIFVNTSGGNIYTKNIK